MDFNLYELFNVKEDELFKLTDNSTSDVYRVHDNILQYKDVDGDFRRSVLSVNILRHVKLTKILTSEEKIKTISGELNEFCKSRNVQLFVGYECNEIMSIIITNIRDTTIRPYTLHIKLDDVEDIDRTLYTLLRSIDEHFTNFKDYVY